MYMCADLCLSLYSVRVQSILIEQLTIVLQVTPKVNCILPQLKQKRASITVIVDYFYHIQLKVVNTL